MLYLLILTYSLYGEGAKNGYKMNLRETTRYKICHSLPLGELIGIRHFPLAQEICTALSANFDIHVTVIPTLCNYLSTSPPPV